MADDEVIDGVIDEDPPAPAEPETRVAKSARAKSPLSRHYGAESPLAPAIDALEKELGGRPALQQALMGLPDSAGLDYVVGLLADPTSDSRKLSAICHAGGISVGELLEAVKRGKLLIPTLKAMTHVAEKIPAVVEDVMLRAAPHHVVCDACDGLTTVAGPTPDSAPVPCEACKGRGFHTHLPDLETQKVALQLAGLGPKGAPGVAIAIDNRKQLGVGSMSDLIRATDAVALRPKPRTVVVDSPPVSPSSPEEPPS